MRLGYSAFAPLPDSFFADPEAFEKQADRCRAVQDRLDQQHRVRAVQVRRLLRRDKPANVDKLTFRIYQDPAAAYADAVAGSLDYIDDSNIPQDQFVGDAYKSDFPDRTSQRESLVISWIYVLLGRPAAQGQARAAQGHLPRPSTAT